jgi:hypothetical protein
MEIEFEFTILLVINICIMLTLVLIKHLGNLNIDPYFFDLIYILFIILFYIFFYFLVVDSCKNINCNVI